MKLRTVKYIIKEGFINSYKNKLMSLASVSIISASLIIFGFFLLLVENLNYNAEFLKQQPQLQVFCNHELDESNVSGIRDAIEKTGMVREYKMVSKEEAFEKLKDMLGKSQDVLEGLGDSDFLEVSFTVKLKDLSDSSRFAEYMMGVEGVTNVTYIKETVDIIFRITNWLQVASGIIMSILLVISVFIIANTIKLALFARRKEIGIMKYIGSTDWFIRWPFIIEGVIIGMVGAIISFIISGYAYNTLALRLQSDVAFSINNMIKLRGFGSLWLEIIGLYMAIGVAVGAIGSLISIRRHLRV